jgi:lysophospholipase L1-like esterase
MDKIKILALGDSYTIGEDVPQEESWPYILKRTIENQGCVVELKVIAKTGWTTDELDAAIDQASIEKKEYDLVFLLIGVNNQYRGYAVDSYQEEFKNLLRKAKSFSVNNSAVVLSIPDWSCTPFASGGDKDKISGEIDLFNEVNLRIAESEQALYINVTEISRRAAAHPEYIASDGLHPSGYQYQKWVEELKPHIDWRKLHC